MKKLRFLVFRLDQFLIKFSKEIKKIVKKDGIIIHIVPSSWWSLITNFWHYCKIPKYLIKSKIINYNPDLVIMYDGWNDAGYPISWNRPSPTIEESKNNWIEICKFGNKHNFDSIITIQPIVGTGNRNLSEYCLLYTSPSPRDRLLTRMPSSA